MQGSALEQPDDVGGTVRQVGLAMALIGIGAVALAPVVSGAGLVAARAGLWTGGAISVADGGYLFSQS